MIHILPNDRRLTENLKINDVITRYGAWRVLISAAGALLSRRTPRQTRGPDTSRLSAHVRKDIGLEPLAETPNYWRHL